MLIYHIQGRLLRLRKERGYGRGTRHESAENPQITQIQVEIQSKALSVSDVSHFPRGGAASPDQAPTLEENRAFIAASIIYFEEWVDFSCDWTRAVASNRKSKVENRS